MQVVEHGKHIARKLEFIYVRAFCFNQRKYPVELSLLSSKICWIYYHYHTLLKLSIHPSRHHTFNCNGLQMEGVWRRGISTPSVEVFQLSKRLSTELKELFNIFLLRNSFQLSPARTLVVGQSGFHLSVDSNPMLFWSASQF